MKFDRPLDDVLGARSKVALLRMLSRTRGEHTGRELARFTALDAKTCHTALRDLAEQGVVQVRRAGAALLYRLNAGHVLFTGLLEPLFAKEASLLEDYARDLRRSLKGRVLSMILFGSVARKEERASSDVDLLVVVPDVASVARMEDSVDRAAGDLAMRYGNPPQVIVLPREILRRKVLAGDAFVSEVLRSGRVVEGKPLAEVLKRVS